MAFFPLLFATFFDEDRVNMGVRKNWLRRARFGGYMDSDARNYILTIGIHDYFTPAATFI